MTATTGEAAPPRGAAAPSARPRYRAGPSSVPVTGWLAAAGVLAALSAIVAARWWATRAGLEPLAVGAAFGAGLVLLALAARARVARETRDSVPGRRARVLAQHLVLGSVAGLALVGLTLAGAALSGAPLIPGLGRPAAPVVSWALITIVVASGEEAVLRGVLFDRLRRLGGVPVAVAITTVAFALIHVPLYGWAVVPLDLAVGLAFAGLRLGTGGIAAPAAAHAVADLATWWL